MFNNLKKIKDKPRSEMSADELSRIRERQRKEYASRKERGIKRNLNKELLRQREVKYRTEKKAKGIRCFKLSSELTDEQRKNRSIAQKKYDSKNPRRHDKYIRKPSKPKTEVQKERARILKKERYAAGIGVEQAKLLRANSRKKISDGKTAWRLKNLNKAREYERKYVSVRRATPHGKITNKVRSAMTTALKCNQVSSKYALILGYTWKDLQNYIISKFTKGMTWEKYLIGEIHIDHIKPLKLFRYESLDDPLFKEAWALSNLQPLWKVDNLKKGSKYYEKTI